MNVSTDHSQSPPSLRQSFVEVALVFAVFCVHGASAVPDVNEPYYLGKAIHFWNPDWVQGDEFLDSTDTHRVFYFTLGWLAMWLSPPATAWCGRLLTWWLLAWSWRRLSFAVVPRAWYSILGAALFVCLAMRYHMAGEWVVGGVEAKGFAYVLVLLGLEALVRDRWNRAWLLMGAAAAFHVLVGGWSVVATGLAWLISDGDRPRLKTIWPGLLGGLVLSLPGLIPSLILTRGVDRYTVDAAHYIYVFLRLYHHLDFAQIPIEFVVRFALMVAGCAVLIWVTPASRANRLLRRFLIGSLILSVAGILIRLVLGTSAPAAWLLRFYWFRLADVIVPLAVALFAVNYIACALKRRPLLGQVALAAAILISGFHLGELTVRRFPQGSPADRFVDHVCWRDACRWIARSEEIPSQARFLTPKLSHTFKWYARRSEVVNWKEIPQDARAIVRWWRRIEDIHGPGRQLLEEPSLARLSAERLKQLGERYDADYVLTVREPPLELDAVYENRGYVIYRLD